MNSLANAMNLEPTNTSAHPSSGARLVSADGLTLPLERSHISVEAGGGLARVVLEQRFKNVHDRPLTVTYLLPMPERGAVSGFDFTIGETRVVGEVDRKREARERFERAIAQGKTAAILDQDRASLFTQEVGNIPPGQEIVCEVMVDQPLEWLPEGAWEWRFPTVVGPRYMGPKGRVKDADKLTVPVADKSLAERLTLSLVIADEVDATRGPESVSHNLRATRRDHGAGSVTEVTFARDRAVRLDRDVVVRWPVATPEVGVTLSSARPSADAHRDRAYGLLTIVPPTPESRPRALPRDLIFLIDTSGSMGGRPLDQARRVVCAMIDTLGDEDRIELIEFGSRPRRWRKEPVAATRDGRKQAMAWVRKLRSSGATEMHSAVLEALRPLRPGCQRQVVLITDGYIGFESQIVSAILENLPDNCRLHTMGVGSAPNRSLTRPAARAGAGVELIIGLDEDAERVAKRLLERTTAPLVTDVRIEGPGVIDVRPHRVPDLFAGSPVLVSVALDPAGGAITVRGTMAGAGDAGAGDAGVAARFEHTVMAESLILGQGAHAVAALYARERVEDLETRASVRGNTADIDQEIERIGLDFQIATRMTSWVAITEEATVEARRPDEGLRQEMPHDLPYGTSIQGFGLRAGSASSVDDEADDHIMYSLREMRPLEQSILDDVAPMIEAAPEEKRRMRLAADRDVDRDEGESAVKAEANAFFAAAPQSLQAEMPLRTAQHKRVNPWPRLLLVLAVILTIAFGLWYWLASGESPSERDASGTTAPASTAPASTTPANTTPDPTR